MHYFLYPTKDTTITNYPHYMYKNMGLDEILEVEKRISYNSCASTGKYTVEIGYTSSSIELLDGCMSASYDPGSTDPGVVSKSYVEHDVVSKGAVLSRALLQFDLTEISRALNSSDPYRPVDPKFYLNLKVCESVEVPIKYTLAAYPLSQSWNMGTGYKYDGNTSADGVTWKFRDGVSELWYSGSWIDCSGGGLWWVTASLLGSGSGYADPTYVVSGEDDVPTPVIENGFYGAQYFDYQSGDVRMDITNIVYAWLSGSIENNGLIVMHSDESSSIDYGTLKFFSKETNTVHSPYIDMAWNDAVLSWTSPGFNTSSAEPIQLRDCVVNMKNMAKEYKFGSILRMDVTPRKRYPVKTFTNKFSDYTFPYYLPSASFYQIKDAESEETIIPYDDYTRLSFDGNGNYFMLDTTGLPQERYFKVEIRAEQSGSIMNYTIPTAFKISR